MTTTGPPKKFVTINGVTKLNPEYQRWKDMQGQGGGGGVPVAAATAAAAAVPTTRPEDNIDLSKFNLSSSGGGGGGGIPVATATIVEAIPSGTLVATATAQIVGSGGVGGGATSYHKGKEALERYQIEALKSQGFPTGLAQELGNTRSTYPLRFWVVDNSGSMRTPDGHQLRGCSADNQVRVVDCNRWVELQGAVEYHAELAGLLQATTAFRLLNDPGIPGLKQEFTVAETTSKTAEAVQHDVDRAKSIIQNTEPRGVTPLTDHLRVIRMRLESMSASLKSNGQQVVIVLATDGLPSDHMGHSRQNVLDEFINALRSLQDLPVWVVVRLCTDDDSVVDYYNDLDKILELPLEVIDDFFGESKEIRAANRWLNYALPLHRCREMGYHHRIFDLLDERLLNKDELHTFLQLLFGKRALENAPDPHADWKGFLEVVTRVVKAQGKQWNPSTKKLDYWIDLKQLDKRYGKRGLFKLF